MTSNIYDLNGKRLYGELTSKREQFLNRARECSELTIPQLFPRNETDDTDGVDYPSPYQSLGARGINNLANKIVLTLFPPATAFFKYGINPIVAKNLNKGEGEVAAALYALEKGTVNEMEISNLRPALVELIKQLLVGGSSILYIPEIEDPRVIPMRKFGIKRSKSGKVLKMIIKEQIYYVELDTKTKIEIGSVDDDIKDNKKPLDIYTICCRVDADTMEVIQEINNVKITDTYGTYKDRDFPYVFIPFVDRYEDYGRSYTEDYLGDIKSYEGLRKSLLEAAAESARIIYLLKPNSTLNIKKLKKAKSGDVLTGDPDSVGVLQADKRLEMQTAAQEAENLKIDLSALFLLDSAVRRNAERVTAEEIRRVSQELEVALGGIYSTLANRLQTPSVYLYLKRLKRKGIITGDLKDSLDLEVTTGSAALGRGVEFNSIQAFINTLASALGPEFIKFVKIDELISRVANSLDIGTSSLVKTQEELQVEAQAQMEQELQAKAVGPAINAASKQEGL